MNNTAITVQPLSWPESIRHPTALHKFLMGFPLLGPDKLAYRRFREEVATRPDDCLALWKEDERTLNVRDRVFDILEKDMRWKSRKFIPADTCDILFFDPGILYKGEDAGLAFMRIGDLFRGSVRDLFGRDGEKLKTVTLGELVDRIAQRRTEPVNGSLPATERIDRKARERMAAAIRSYMDGMTTVSQLDDVLAEVMKTTQDKTVESIRQALWHLTTGVVKDGKIVASKEDWDHFNRLVLLLDSDGEMEVVKGRRRWRIGQCIAVLCLVGFLYIAFQTGFGEHLFFYATPFGAVSMILVWFASRQRKRETATEPFPSVDSLLSVRRQVPGFTMAEYPKTLTGRRIREPFIETLFDKFMLIPLGLVWLMCSPLPLFFQMLPRRERETRIRMPKPEGEKDEHLRGS